MYPAVGGKLCQGGTICRKILRSTSTLNKDIKLNPNFVNRNPRNLENMNLLKKDIGWGTKQDKDYGMKMDKEAVNLPQRNYYNCIKVYPKSRSLSVEIEHMSGNVIIKADASEWAIKKQLHKTDGMSAYINMAHVVAQRCFRNGIDCVQWGMPEELTKNSQSLSAFKEALIESGLQVEEPPVKNIDYKVKRVSQYYDKFL